MPIGFRILPRRRRVDAAVAERFRALPVANVSDVMFRMNGAGASIVPMHAGGAMAGPAFTVRTRPGDNLMVHKALALMEPGDVLVVDGGGDLSNALMGELMLSHALARGAAGVVVNGAIRDRAWIRANALPVFAAGVNHRGPYKDGPGEINVPVAFGSMLVEPGDLVIGDDDGVLCVPFGDVEAVYAAARAKNEAEAKILADTEAGRLDTKEWVDRALERLGCEDLTRGSGS